MTNYDPGGLLVLLTLLPSLVGGAISIVGAHLAARMGYGDYETNVALLVGVLLLVWIGAALVYKASMLQILAVVLAMAGAYAITRSITAASYGWLLGVVLLFGAFVAANALGIYRGVDPTGSPQGVIARNLRTFYYVGLLITGALGGAIVVRLGDWFGRRE